MNLAASPSERSVRIQHSVDSVVYREQIAQQLPCSTTRPPFFASGCFVCNPAKLGLAPGRPEGPVATETKLTVILHADIVGSTELVRRDERLAHERIQSAFRRFSEAISSQGGTTHEIRGDALVVEFERASDAVNAALAFQSENRQHNATLDDPVQPEVRVGIALGEVVIADKTVTGVGVVLAQRLEQLAAPGGVCISAAVREALPDRLAVDYVDLGEQTLKGFERPQRAYIVQPAQEDAAMPDSRVTEQARAERPSIAVLPFDNLSSDPEQEFFADGMAEDIITALSKFSELIVIARNTTFTFKGQAVDISEVGKQLRVRYVVEGSVRQAGGRIRVTAQLIDTSSGGHLWAERYDRSLDDIFAVQDEVTEAIVGALAPTVGRAEIERARQAPPENLDAWTNFQIGLSKQSVYDDAMLREAERHFRRAVELDPDFSLAYAWLARTTIRRAHIFEIEQAERTQSFTAATALAQRAIELNPGNAVAHSALSMVMAVEDRPTEAIAAAMKAVSLNPNLPAARMALGYAYFCTGQLDESLTCFNQTLRLDPIDPGRVTLHILLCHVNRALGQYDEAVSHGRAACEVGLQSYIACVHLASALSLAGQQAEAEAAATRARELQPGISADYMAVLVRSHPPIVRDPLLEGLRRAGL